MWPRNLASRYRKRPRKQTHRNRVISFREWLSYAERYLLEVENVITVSSNVQAACVSGDFKKRELLGKNKYTQKSSTSGKNNLSHCASRRLEEVHGKSNLCLDP